MPETGHADPTCARITLVLGGARSGKSTYAEQLLASHDGPRFYVATATAGDTEMTERIAAHRARRGPAWHTIEEPLDLANVLRENDRPGAAILVDCLTLWLSNVMAAARDVATETGRLLSALRQIESHTVLVSNEVGLGIVPDNALARAYRDHAGRLNQAVAGTADRVVFVAAGLPLSLKP